MVRAFAPVSYKTDVGGGYCGSRGVGGCRIDAQRIRGINHILFEEKKPVKVNKITSNSVYGLVQ